MLIHQGLFDCFHLFGQGGREPESGQPNESVGSTDSDNPDFKTISVFSGVINPALYTASQVFPSRKGKPVCFRISHLGLRFIGTESGESLCNSRSLMLSEGSAFSWTSRLLRTGNSANEKHFAAYHGQPGLNNTDCSVDDLAQTANQ